MHDKHVKELLSFDVKCFEKKKQLPINKFDAKTIPHSKLRRLFQTSAR